MTEMIINGKKLANYLAKYGVSKRDFAEVLNTGDIYFSEEDYEYGVEQDAQFTDTSLYQEKVRIEPAMFYKMMEHIGEDHMVGIINWEAMGFDYNEITINELLKILIENASFNARKSRAI